MQDRGINHLGEPTANARETARPVEVRRRTRGRSAAVQLLTGSAAITAAIAAGGCGASRAATPQALRLERADLVAVARALDRLEPSVHSEVTATRAAWPLVVNGLPPSASAGSRARVATASSRAAAIGVPGLFEEQQAASLTGPGSSLAGTFRSFSILSARGWQLIGAAIEQIERGPTAAARFARANVALYIESVYDAHFGLAQIGKKLAQAYRELGADTAFGASLTQAEVDALANSYSEANDRLHPHTGVRLGS